MSTFWRSFFLYFCAICSTSSISERSPSDFSVEPVFASGVYFLDFSWLNCLFWGRIWFSDAEFSMLSSITIGLFWFDCSCLINLIFAKDFRVSAADGFFASYYFEGAGILSSFLYRPCYEDFWFLSLFSFDAMALFSELILTSSSLIIWISFLLINFKYWP